MVMEFHETGWLIIIKWVSLKVKVSWESKLWVMFNQLMADWGKVCQSKKWSAAGLQNLFQLLLAMLLLKQRIGEKAKHFLEAKGHKLKPKTRDDWGPISTTDENLIYRRKRYEKDKYDIECVELFGAWYKLENMVIVSWQIVHSA